MSLVRVAVVVRVVAALVRGPKRVILKGLACIEPLFLHFGTGLGSGGSKRLICKGRACTESIILGFWHGSGLWGGGRVALPCHSGC